MTNFGAAVMRNAKYVENTAVVGGKNPRIENVEIEAR